jgi:outer membrane protein TolC
MENELRTARDMKAVTEARLNTLLNRNTDADIGIPQPINTGLTTLEIDELYGMTRTNHPQLAAARHMVERAELMKSFAYQHYLPDFMFTYQHYLPDFMFKFTQVEMEGELTDQKYMVGFTVPLWFLGKQNKMVSEASAQIEMLQAYYENVENSLLLDVKAAKVETDKSKRTLILYEQSIIPQAHANMKSALVAYEANQVDFMTLLESERILLQFQLEQYRAQADFFKSIADLEEAVGTNIFLD